MSLQTKTCSRTHFDRKEKFIPAFNGPWNSVCFKMQRLQVLSVSSLQLCYMSDLWGLLQTSNTGQLKSWNRYEIKQPCTKPFLLSLISKCVFCLSNSSKQKQWVLCGWEALGSTTLCNWFSKPESSEIALHMELNCRVQPYRHSHNNPLPILQLAPWQTRGTGADNPLSK